MASRDFALDVVVVVVLAGVSGGRGEKTGSDDSAGKLGNLDHLERKAGVEGEGWNANECDVELHEN